MNQSDASVSYNILHVEDNPGDVFITSRAFKKATVTTEITNISDGEKAKKYLSDCASNVIDKPDLILLDINLPTINGDELLEWIMQQEPLQDIPVVVLSGSKASRDIEKMKKYGARTYLTKSGDSDSLKNVVVTVENFLRAPPSGPPSEAPAC